MGPIGERGEVDSGQLALEVTFELNPRWRFQGSAGYAFDNQRALQNNLVNFDALTKSLATSNPSVAFNPFGSGSNTDPATLAAIRASGDLDYRSAFSTLNLDVVGSMPLLPASR